MARLRTVLLACLSVVLLGGCAGQPTTEDRPKPTPPRAVHQAAPRPSGSAVDAAPVVNITPFSQLTQAYVQDNVPSIAYPAAYTRLRIDGVVPTGNDASSAAQFPYERRNWFSRWLFGRHTSTNLTVKVSAGSFTATVPLVTIDHASNKSDGESFSRIVYHQAENFPLFLVKRDGSNGIISVRAAVKVSDLVQSGAAGAALQVAQTVARTVAPTTSVLTTLTTQDANNVAAALDAAVNKLFSASVDEEQWTDSDIRLWGDGAAVKFFIPRSEGDLTGPQWTVGVWTVTFANPRPSAFSDIEVCFDADHVGPNRCRPSFKAAAVAAEAEVGAADVLAFRLTNTAGGLGTVESFIKNQDWYTSALKAFAAQPTDDDAVAFCRAIKTSVAGLDLNDVDQGLVAHAVVTGMPLPAAARVHLQSERGAQACACRYGCQAPGAH